MRTRKRALFVFVMAAVGTAILPSEALAYIGPGAGLSAFGSLLALVAATVVGLFGFIWFPIKRAARMLKSKRRRPARPSITVEGRRQ